MIRMQVGHQNSIDVVRLDTDGRQIACEQTELGSENGSTTTVYEYEAIRHVQQERVHRDPRWYGAVGCAVQCRQLVPWDVGDVVEEIDCAAKRSVIERGDKDVAKRVMVDAGHLPGGLGWTGHVVERADDHQFEFRKADGFVAKIIV